jgi:uncharacterized protein (DUF608 family)
MNQLYYFVEGGSVWFIKEGQKYGMFAYLESLDYLLYNTYDVHFYASFALIMLWPELELDLQRFIAKSCLTQDDEKIQTLHSGQTVSRHVHSTVPHDVGCSGNDPFIKINDYNIQDVSQWKDLPCKFVLQVYRDYIFTGRLDFLVELFPTMKVIMHKTLEFDRNHDGVIENEGYPDQTYDAWFCSGIRYLSILTFLKGRVHTLVDCGWLQCLPTLNHVNLLVGKQKTWNNLLKYSHLDASPTLINYGMRRMAI